MKERVDKIVTKGELALTDPCYELDANHIGVSNNVITVKKGTYNCYFEHTKEAQMVSSMTVLHESVDYDSVKDAFDEKYFEENHLCVDSGTMCIADAEWYRSYRQGPNKKVIYDELGKKTYESVPNTQYIKYISTEEYKTLTKQAKEKIDKVLAKYQMNGDESLWEAAVQHTYGWYTSEEFESFCKHLCFNLDFNSKLMDLVWAKMDDETRKKVNSSCVDIAVKKSIYYAIYVNKEIKKEVVDIAFEITKALGKEEHNPFNQNKIQACANTYDSKCYIASSGYGDGVYPYCVLTDDNGEVYGVQILFIDEEAIDEEE